MFEQGLHARKIKPDLVAAAGSSTVRASKMWPITAEGQTDSTPQRWKLQLASVSCIEPKSKFKIVQHECKCSLDGTQHWCPLQESRLNGSSAASACEGDQCKCMWGDCKHTYCCCCSTEINPTICRTHDQPMPECSCRVVATNATGEPDTGVC